MIDLSRFRGGVVHVVGSGASAAGFRRRRGEPVIACNHAALALEDAPDVHLAVDWPYWRALSPRRGSLGVWVRLGDEPVPRDSGAHVAIPCSTGRDHWGLKWGRSLVDGVMVAGGAGAAAWNLADILGADHVELWGFDGGGRWETMRPGLDYAAAHARAGFTDHAGRLRCVRPN